MALINVQYRSRNDIQNLLNRDISVNGLSEFVRHRNLIKLATGGMEGGV